jgi:hypothetical protein
VDGKNRGPKGVVFMQIRQRGAMQDERSMSDLVGQEETMLETTLIIEYFNCNPSKRTMLYSVY